MKKIILLFIVLFLIAGISSGCARFDTSPPPLNQSVEKIIKIELVYSRDQSALFSKDTHASCVLYTLKPEQITEFMDKFLKLEFRKPLFDPVTDLGDLAVWIYYQDGNSDIIGYSANRYFDNEYNRLAGKWWYYLQDKSVYYDLFAEYVPQEIMPKID